jgi:L-ascorbate 6-phosphate lactonase
VKTEDRLENRIILKGKELIRAINRYHAQKGEMAFCWLGQFGYVMSINNVIIYIDPFLSPDAPDRKYLPLLNPEDVDNATIILGTHDHSDHIDRNVWPSISDSSPSAVFIVPKIILPLLSNDLNIPKERFYGIDDGSSIIINGLKITGIAAAHEFLDQDPISGHFPYMGYVIEGNGCTIYHSGDCCIYEGLLTKLKKWDYFDIMFLPINGRDGRRYRANCIGNMTFQEAADLAGAIKPGLVVPAHYEMFDFNSADPLMFTDYLDAKYPSLKYWVGQQGSIVSYKKS